MQNFSQRKAYLTSSKQQTEGRSRLSPPTQRFIRGADIKSRAQNDRNDVSQGYIIYQDWRNDTVPTLHGEFLSLRRIDKSVLFGNLSVQGYAGFYIACVSRPKDGVFDTA